MLEVSWSPGAAVPVLRAFPASARQWGCCLSAFGYVLLQVLFCISLQVELKKKKVAVVYEIQTEDLKFPLNFLLNSHIYTFIAKSLLKIM